MVSTLTGGEYFWKISFDRLNVNSQMIVEVLLVSLAYCVRLIGSVDGTATIVLMDSVFLLII